MGHQRGAKKSLYLFLCALLGSLLFLILHQVLVFCYLTLLNFDYADFNFSLSYLQYLAIDYFTLILALLGGAWYGIWVGIYWYEAIYEREEHEGFVGHIVSRYWPSKGSSYNLEKKVAAAAHKVEEDMWELEDLAKSIPEIKNNVAVKKRIVRRKVK